MKPRERICICALEGCGKPFIATRPWHLFCSRECATQNFERVKLEVCPLVVTADGQLRLDEPSPEEQEAWRKRRLAQVKAYRKRLERIPPRTAATKIVRDIRSGGDRSLTAFMALAEIWDEEEPE